MVVDILIRQLPWFPADASRRGNWPLGPFAVRQYFCRLSETSARRNYNESFCFFEKNPKNLLAEPLLRKIEPALLIGYQILHVHKGCKSKEFFRKGVGWAMVNIRSFEKFWASDHGPQWVRGEVNIKCNSPFVIRWFHNILLPVTIVSGISWTNQRDR